MEKTIATQMRTLAMRTNETKRQKKAVDYRKYIEHIVATKVRKAASKGLLIATFKLKKNFSVLRTLEELSNMGFNSYNVCKNGKQIITIKW